LARNFYQKIYYNAYGNDASLATRPGWHIPSKLQSEFRKAEPNGYRYNRQRASEARCGGNNGARENANG
jgi:hypothetical protein